MAGVLAKSAPLVVTTLKSLATQTLNKSPAEAGALAREKLLRVAKSEDGAEGGRAFREKRAPVFAGVERHDGRRNSADSGLPELRKGGQVDEPKPVPPVLLGALQADRPRRWASEQHVIPGSEVDEFMGSELEGPKSD